MPIRKGVSSPGGGTTIQYTYVDERTIIQLPRQDLEQYH